MATQSRVLQQTSATTVTLDWKTLCKYAMTIFGLTMIVSFVIPALYGVYTGVTTNGNMEIVNQRLDTFTNSYWTISAYWVSLFVVARWQGRVLTRSGANGAMRHIIIAAVLAMLNQFALNATLEVTNGTGHGNMLVLGTQWLVSMVCLFALATIPRLRQATASGVGLGVALAVVFGLLLHPLVVTLAANSDTETTIQIIVMWTCCIGGAYLGARGAKAQAAQTVQA